MDGSALVFVAAICQAGVRQLNGTRVAPLVVREMLGQLVRLKQSGVTILLSEQNLGFALKLADRVYIIEKGSIKYQGTPDSLAADRATREAYLMV